jgi:hypothetical protein
MLLVAVLVIFGQFLTAGAVALWARRQIRAKEAEIRERILQFVTAPEPGRISPLAELVELTAARFATQIVSQLKAQLMVGRSHEAKQENLLQQDIMIDTATQQSPLLGLIAGAFPSVTKRIAKNPSALPALMSLIQKMGSGGSGAGGQLGLWPGTHATDSSGNGGGSVADRIKRQR